jgi:hypothetical protein
LLEEKEDWRAKYAKITTKKVFAIPASLRLNPHEPQAITKSALFSQEQNLGLPQGHIIR